MSRDCPRNSIITMARDLGLPIEIRALTVRDLFSADEAFFTGTAAEVTPIRAVEGRPIGRGVRGVAFISAINQAGDTRNYSTKAGRVTLSALAPAIPTALPTS